MNFNIAIYKDTSHNKLVRFLFYILIVSSLSCNSDDDSSDVIIKNQDEIFGLKVGNQWVYKYYVLDQNNGEYLFSGAIDEVSILGTEEILGNLYYKVQIFTSGNDSNNSLIKQNGISINYLRVFEGNLIDNSNNIIFSITDFSEHLISESMSINFYSRTNEDQVNIVVDAGEFDCYLQELYARNSDGEILPGISQLFYNEGVGLIKEGRALVASESIQVERRLDSYNFN